MKKLNIYVIVILSSLFIYSCGHNHDHSNGHDDHHHDDHSDHSDHDNHADHDDHDDHGKTVHLNKAQFDNAEIDTGWFALKNLTDVIHANGYTKLDPQDQAEVSMPIKGTIKEINVIEGNYVKKGQILAVMSSLELGDKLMQKAMLEERISIAQEKQSYLQKEYDRQSILANENINAKKILDKVRSELNIEQKKISAAQNQLEILGQTITMYGGSNANYISITAPISGHITHSDLMIGATVKAGENMFSIVDNSKMHVDLLLYEKDLSQIKVGQKVRFMITNQSNEEIEGEIYNIGKSFANDTKSVAVHADIENNDANLIPGMYLSALIDIGDNKVRAVPEEAIVLAEGRHFIFLYEAENDQEEKPHMHENGSVHESHDDHDDHGDHDDHDDHGDEIGFARLEVKLGSKQLGYVAVTPLEEIHAGDRIVLKGAYYLQSHLQKSEGGGGHHH